MSNNFLITVEKAAEILGLHPKTVLRYIRNGQLPATRVGKSYRIVRTQLDAFSGAGVDRGDFGTRIRTTCIVDIADLTVQGAERVATLLQAVPLTVDSHTLPLHLQTAFDPLTNSMKVILIGSPSDVSKLLEMVELQVRNLT